MWNVRTSYTYLHKIIRIRYNHLSCIYWFAFPIELNFITFVRRSHMVLPRLFLLQYGQKGSDDIKVISLSAYFFNFLSVLLYVYKFKKYFWCKILKRISFIHTTAAVNVVLSACEKIIMHLGNHLFWIDILF